MVAIQFGRGPYLATAPNQGLLMQSEKQCLSLHHTPITDGNYNILLVYEIEYILYPCYFLSPHEPTISSSIMVQKLLSVSICIGNVKNCGYPETENITRCDHF